MKLMCISGLLLLAAASAFAQTPPATAPADDPKSALRVFEKGMLSGDDKAVIGNMIFATDKSRTDAVAIFGPQLANSRLQKALDAAFPNADNLPHLVPDATEIKKEDDELNAATVTRTGDTAVVTIDKDEKLTVVLQNGTWKIDFDATQKAMGENPTDSEIKNAALIVKAVDAITADVAAKKYKTPDDVLTALHSRIDAIDNPTGMGGAGPATQP